MNRKMDSIYFCHQLKYLARECFHNAVVCHLLDKVQHEGIRITLRLSAWTHCGIRVLCVEHYSRSLRHPWFHPLQFYDIRGFSRVLEEIWL